MKKQEMKMKKNEEGWSIMKSPMVTDEPYDDLTLGYYDSEGENVIAINIWGIWHKVCADSRVKCKEDVFIKWYGKILAHEYIHQEIGDVIMNLFDVGEEKINDKIIGRIW